MDIHMTWEGLAALIGLFGLLGMIYSGIMRQMKGIEAASESHRQRMEEAAKSDRRLMFDKLDSAVAEIRHGYVPHDLCNARMEAARATVRARVARSLEEERES